MRDVEKKPLVCAECGTVSGKRARGWRALSVSDDDELLGVQGPLFDGLYEYCKWGPADRPRACLILKRRKEEAK